MQGRVPGPRRPADRLPRPFFMFAQAPRLAEMRKRRGMTQEQVAARMGVSVARVSQIEAGDVSTQDVLNRYVAALGGTLKLIADFGDEQLKIA
jgi:transcriptional regulator with XRE-family HTH domain